MTEPASHPSLSERALRMLDRGRAKARERSVPLAQRRSNALDEVERFITEGLAHGDEPQALLGCMIKAQLRDRISIEGIGNDFWQDNQLRHLATGMDRIDYTQTLGDHVGMSIAMEDYLATHYGEQPGRALGHAFTVFVFDAEEQGKLLMEELQAHHINPFADLRVAFVGGAWEFMENFCLKKLFRQFEEFDGRQKLDFDSAAATSEKFDYVISVNVLDAAHEFPSNPELGTTGVFCASANLLKRGGKAIHIINYSGWALAPAILEEPFHRFSGVAETADFKGIHLPKVIMFEKTEDKTTGLHQLQSFLRARAEGKPYKEPGAEKAGFGATVRRWLHRGGADETTPASPSAIR